MNVIRNYANVISVLIDRGAIDAARVVCQAAINSTRVRAFEVLNAQIGLGEYDLAKVTAAGIIASNRVRRRTVPTHFKLVERHIGVDSDDSRAVVAYASAGHPYRTNCAGYRAWLHELVRLDQRASVDACANPT
jgi:hypothetical protein